MPVDDVIKPHHNMPRSPVHGTELRFGLVFLLLFFALQYGYLASQGSGEQPSRCH